MSTILVTGGSGFIGSHVILQLLAADRPTSEFAGADAPIMFDAGSGP